MKRMKWLTLVSCFALLAVVLPIGHTVDAVPSQEVWRTYYSNASRTIAVGQKFVTSCYGVVNQMIWGVTSPYSRSESFPCY